jgi:hypothetical protein
MQICRAHMNCTGKEGSVFGETVKSSTLKRVKSRADSVFTSKGFVIEPCTVDVHHN